MTRALLVVNFNNALCGNSRASMQAACQRWDAEFVELDEAFFAHRPKPAVSPAALKCFCFDLTDAEEIFILDADVVVSEACPNPFETFPGPELVAVQNGSERFGDLWQIRSCERYEWDKLSREDVRFADVPYWVGRYFNTGMMLVRRAHHKELFELIRDVVQTDHGLGWNDQTPINAAVAKLRIPLRLTDERWNFIHPCMLGGGWANMISTGVWIYHGAGEPDRIGWLPVIKWQR
jgi:hypothetical protein